MAFLSGAKIQECIQLGEITVDPFFVDSLQPNSIDVHLGQYLWRDDLRVADGYRDPFAESDAMAYPPGWSTKAEDSYIGPFDLLDIRGGYLFHPGMFLLGHTLEKIGSDFYVPMLSARSTTRRLGLTICCCAGFGDIGYNNHWTLEITNTSKVPILLRAGMPIGQISFTTIEGTKNLYKNRYSEKPNTPWNPKDMLPKPMEINPSVGYYLKEKQSNNV